MDVNPALSFCIISHESQWVANKTGPEKIGASEGLWQIYLRDHPSITKKEADNFIWATNWALMQIKNGHVSWWSTYKEYCHNIKVMI